MGAKRSGLETSSGYYEPIIRVSRNRDAFYKFPILNKNKLYIKKVFRQNLPDEALDKSLPTDPVNFGVFLKEIINENKFGNGCCIFTSSGEKARKFSQNVNIGMVGVNIPLPVPSSFHSFGGWKDSLFGDLNMYGPDGLLSLINI